MIKQNKKFVKRCYPQAVWCPHQESNLDHRLRRSVFYPLNYEDMSVDIITVLK